MYNHNHSRSVSQLINIMSVQCDYDILTYLESSFSHIQYYTNKCVSDFFQLFHALTFSMQKQTNIQTVNFYLVFLLVPCLDMVAYNFYSEYEWC